ncbi:MULTISPECIES: menaquinone-dependent protoporphyrinogen IX dehydrogenase [Deefgea]|uniref:Menaquinone-dependent protoporphyrinogen IX dehydrogenase n=1 Tax=Deefgea chitinilytica TaxID=570276 RepID=A0ABS2C9B1_9NEIS|nr:MULTISPECIES: menaquinone-dependent protoporphyrinogen IX dehydrogenase [Deefgea]MBM5570068.1 menaquinone-dependent protoporphyrinogen IX dehydrogenase [Deefgea chitinilytica]MBM9887297.1 menaquinone-dependent protoporphyrinogen IX dehydrogenase [Deefgea sp. CFH1-16]
MPTILIPYASHDGQAQRIATLLAEHLSNADLHCVLLDLHQAAPEQNALQQASLIVLVAAVRYGKHLPAATRWLQRHRSILNTLALAVISVNLTARNREKCDLNRNTYLKKLLNQYAIKPIAACAIAGKLDYPRYRWIDRQMIRLIMLLTGGPTNPSVSTEFTDWHAVQSFAEQLAELATQRR